MITYTIEKLSEDSLNVLLKSKPHFDPIILKFKHCLQGNTSKVYTEEFEYIIGKDWYKDPLEYEINYINCDNSNWPRCHWCIKDDDELASLLSFDLRRITKDGIKIINKFSSSYNKVELTLDKTGHVVSAFALSTVEDIYPKVDVLCGFSTRQIHDPIPDVFRRREGHSYVNNYIQSALNKLDNTKSVKEKINIMNSVIHDINRHREIFCDYDFSYSNSGTINDIT